MPIRALLRFLSENEYIIKKISESKPVTRAAQLTVYMYHKAKDIGLQQTEKMKIEAEKGGKRLISFTERLKKEFSEEFEKQNKQIKGKK